MEGMRSARSCDTRRMDYADGSTERENRVVRRMAGREWLARRDAKSTVCRKS